MYRKTPLNISQSAKGLFKLKHFLLVILVFWKNPGCSCCHSPAVPAAASAGGWQHRNHLPWPPARDFSKDWDKVFLQSIDAFQKHRMITILQFYQAPKPRHLHFMWNTWFGTFQCFFITEHTPLLHVHNRRSWNSSSLFSFFFFNFFFL